MMIKRSILFLTLLAMVSTVSAVPDLGIEPSDVDRTGNQSLYASQENEVNLTFVNEDSDEKIFDVSPESSGFVDNENVSVKFSKSGFNISAGENKTIQAIIKTSEPTSFTDSSPVIYEYNTSDGMESNTSKFPELSFNVETNYERTNVSLNPLRKSFEAGLGENVKSTFEINNLEGVSAYNVSISGEDAGFEKNNIEISGDESVLVDFNISVPVPGENKTEATNRTYTKVVNVSGQNFNSTSFKVDVFVPFRDYLEDDKMTQAELIESLRDLQNLQGLGRVEEFCSREGNEELPLFGGDIVVYNNNTEVVEKQPEFNDLSTEEILEIANVSDVSPEEYERVKRRVNVLQNNVNELKSSVNGDLSQLNESQRQRYSEVQRVLEENNELENKTRQAELRRLEFEKNVVYALLGLGVSTLFGFGVLFGYRRINKDSLEEFVA